MKKFDIKPQLNDRNKNLIERWDNLSKEWDRGSLAMESIDIVQQECSELPFSEQYRGSEMANLVTIGSTKDENGNDSLVSPITSLMGDGLSRRESLVVSDSILLGESGAVETAQQFFKWFVQIEEEMEQGQEDGYRTHLTLLRTYESKVKSVLAKLDNGLVDLDRVLANYVQVDKLIRGVQASCDRQVEEQTQFLQLHSEIQMSLLHFRDLDAIVRFLSMPGDDICLDDRFEPFLDDMDASIAFLDHHKQYKESAFYVSKYRQYLTRALSLVKSYFASSMRNLVAECASAAQAPANAAVPLDSALPSLPLWVYVPFQAAAPQLRVLVVQIERRVPSHWEYQSLLNDCMNSYFQARLECIGTRVNLQVAELANGLSGTTEPPAPENKDTPDKVWTPKEILAVTQRGCVYLRQLCLDESELVALFFKPENAAVADKCHAALLSFLEAVCSSLYETMRPLILQESRIDVLIELCGALGIYVRSSEQDSVVFIIRRILADAQQRLIFRAQQYMQNEIARFKLAPQYLDLLEKARGAMVEVTEPSEPEAVQDESAEPLSAVSPPSSRLSTVSLDYTAALSVGSGGEWYPTVGRTLWILNKLYTCVQLHLFEDMAHDAIEMCRQSLLGASVLIRVKRSVLESELFLIKNYLLLREHLASDFSSVQFIRKSTALGLSNLIAAPEAIDTQLSESTAGLEIRRASSGGEPTSPRSPSFGDGRPATPWSLQRLSRATTGLMQVLANPKRIIVERISDEKKELDQDLRKACEVLITDVAQRTLEPISQFLEQVAQMQTRSAPDKEYKLILQNQVFAKPEQLAATVQKFQDLIKTCLSSDFARIRTSLRDPRTEQVLEAVIQTNIINTFQIFYQLVKQEYEADVLKTFIISPEAVKGLISEI